MRRARGFTLVELLMVVVVLGVLSGLGLLKYIDLRATARTASLTGDIRSVQVAAVNYYAEHEVWPPEAGPGQVPTGLGPLLPGPLAASFDRTFYVLDYQNILVDDQPLIGVAVETTDPKLMAKFVAAFAGKSTFMMLNGRLTYFIAGPGGLF